MEQQLLLNKYKPIYFNDFDTDDKLIDIMRTLLNINNLNILFIGNIGVGKTSFINAIIKEYYKDLNSIDINNNILYINSLKEQGINYYRNDVKTFCQTCSSIKNKKKIVVLDDIDIINEQSQQVFRNCMDKYGHNVHFIASCNNSQKVIESLQSRFTILQINPLTKENLRQILNKIILKENINISNDSIEYILNISSNSAKMLINYLEKFKLISQYIDLDLATQICTNISFTLYEQYTYHLINNDLKNAIKMLYEIFDKGYSVMDILDNYFLFVKSTNILSEAQKYNIIPIICKYITIFHNIHEDEIELALFTNNLSKAF